MVRLSIFPQKILVPLFDAQLSEKPLALAKKLAHGKNCKIVILNIIDVYSLHLLDTLYDSYELGQKPIERTVQIVEEEKKLQAKALEDHVRASFEGFYVEFISRKGSPARVIVKEAHATSADLIVLQKEKSFRLVELLFGSIVDKVIFGVECPVVLVHE